MVRLASSPARIVSNLAQNKTDFTAEGTPLPGTVCVPAAVVETAPQPDLSGVDATQRIDTPSPRDQRR
jgi:hypothetical protein